MKFVQKKLKEISINGVQLFEEKKKNSKSI
jgi:hypothetical protein